MAKILGENIPGLTWKPLAGGRTGYYWEPSPKLRKAKWDRAPLGTDLSAAITKAKERNAEIARWADGGAKPKAVAKFIVRHSFADLVDQYQREELPKKSLKTRVTYKAKINILMRWTADGAKLGALPVLSITPDNVARLRDALMKPDRNGRVRQGGAHGTLRFLRALLAFAEDKGIIPKGGNPAKEFKLGAPPPRRQIWQPTAMPVFAEAADRLHMSSIGFAAILAREVGQREEDMLLLSRNQWVEILPWEMSADTYAKLAAERGDVMGIDVVQMKTGTQVKVPVVGDTRRLVEQWIERSADAGVTTLIFDEERGVPWQQTRFQRKVLQIRLDCARVAVDRLSAIAHQEHAPSIALAAEIAIATAMPLTVPPKAPPRPTVLGIDIAQLVNVIIADSAQDFWAKGSHVQAIDAGEDGKYRLGPRIGQRFADAQGKVTALKLDNRKGAQAVILPPETATRLRNAAQASKAAGKTILLLDERAGAPWAPREFMTRWNHCRVAGDAWGVDFIWNEFGDLRRTAVVHLGTLGIPVHLIAGITGHTIDETTEILKHYLPMTTGQAAEGIALRAEREAQVIKFAERKGKRA